MSVENIYNDLYPFLLKDWKNTSLLVDRNNSNKSFSNVLKEFIQYANKKSQYSLNVEALTLYEEKILKVNNHESCQLIFDNMVARYNETLSLDVDIFTSNVLDYLSKHTNFINSLRPQGWEQFILGNRKNNWSLSNYDGDVSRQRELSFKGSTFQQEEFAFYDKISLYMTANKFLESNVPPHLTLFKSVSEYVINYNKEINTKLIIDNIEKLVKDGVYDKNIKSCFSQYLDNTYIKLDFEIIEENEKKKDELNKILKKLSKVK